MDAHLRKGAALLLRAHDYSVCCAREAWDFAVEIQALWDAGLTNNDLRWLFFKGLVQPATETPAAPAHARSFSGVGAPVLSDRCCFVLTAGGVAFAEALCGAGGGAAEVVAPARPEAPADLSPRWEPERRILRFRGELVKQFKGPAPNQELILVSFQEEGWPLRIDDPLPKAPLIDPKRRLHDTLNSLNRNQRAPVLRFCGDGSGQAICWEPAPCRTGVRELGAG